MDIRYRVVEESRYVSEVWSDEDELLQTSDPFDYSEDALESGRKWAFWYDNVALGRAESVYYVLAVPETWPGPPVGAHRYSGLHVKIGRGTDVVRRVKNLRTGGSAKLIIHALEPGNAEIERRRHQQFQMDRRQGEWFSCSPQLTKHIFTIWKRHNLLPPEHQCMILALQERINFLSAIRRDIFHGPPDMVNPSLNESWKGNVLVDLIWAHPIWEETSR